MLETIASLPVIDAHCHHLTAQLAQVSADHIARILCPGALGTPDWPSDHAREFLSFKRMIREMARYLGCDDGPDAVMAARAARVRGSDAGGSCAGGSYARGSYAAYVDGMLKAANIEALVLDLGFPGPDTYPEFEALTDIPRRLILRETWLSNTLAKEQLGFKEFLRRFDAYVENEVRVKGSAGLKSYIAATTGLGVEPASEASAETQYPEFLAGKARQTKAFNDFMFCRAADHCIDMDVPLQVHTCIFGGRNLTMEAVRPSLLQPFLQHRRGANLKLVLVHGGFPWVEEAAALAALFPDVWLDMSQWVVWNPLMAAQRLLTILTIAPANRVMYGSDGAFIPEFHWFGALTGREAVAQAMTELVRGEFLDEAQALTMARMILADNARALYRL
ncbi:MAG: amidohydrolase family protein [Bacillota bacterium]|nr:amidohydrolase family protein [Bacillota bacterium]